MHIESVVRPSMALSQIYILQNHNNSLIRFKITLKSSRCVTLAQMKALNQL